jgi:hypothetical protein
VDRQPPTRQGRFDPVPAALAGLLVVATAVLAGLLLTVLVAAVGVEVDQPLGYAGPWLAGLGLLGTWSREVTTTVPVGGGFTETLRLAPLAVTAVAVGSGALLARRTGRGRVLPSAAVAGAAAAVAGAGLAAVVVHTTVRTNEAGSVEVVRALHPGWTALGAGTMAALAWAWGACPPDAAWRRPWRDARALLVVPGLLLTVVVAVALALLVLPGAALPTVLLTVVPLLGSLLVLGAAGAPLTVDASLVTAEPVRLSTAGASPLYLAAGAVVAVALAAVVGVVRGRREPRRGAAAVAGTALAVGVVATGIAWVTAVVADLPPGIGGPVTVQLAVLPATLAGLVLGLVAGLVAVRSGHLHRRAGEREDVGHDDDVHPVR